MIYSKNITSVKMQASNPLEPLGNQSIGVKLCPFGLRSTGNKLVAAEHYKVELSISSSRLDKGTLRLA